MIDREVFEGGGKGKGGKGREGKVEERGEERGRWRRGGFEKVVEVETGYVE